MSILFKIKIIQVIFNLNLHQHGANQLNSSIHCCNTAYFSDLTGVTPTFDHANPIASYILNLYHH